MHDNDSSVDLSEPWLYRLQDSSHGFTEMIEQIMALADVRLKKLDQRRRETVPASELILGMQCGGSDAFSGITANPALGYASDLLLRAGATVMFSEVTEVRDAIYLLTSRAQNEDVARELVRRWTGTTVTWPRARRTEAPIPRRVTRRAGCRILSRSRWAPSSNPAAVRSPVYLALASASAKGPDLLRHTGQ